MRREKQRNSNDDDDDDVKKLLSVLIPPISSHSFSLSKLIYIYYFIYKCTIMKEKDKNIIITIILFQYGKLLNRKLAQHPTTNTSFPFFYTNRIPLWKARHLNL